MNKLTLKKKIFDNDYICVGEKWISNGHWAAKKSLFIEDILITTYESFTIWLGKVLRTEGSKDDRMPNILPQKNQKLKEYKLTPWRYKKACVFESEDNDFIFIDDSYKDAFGIEMLWTFGDDINTPCYNASSTNNITVIIMRMREDEKTLPIIKKTQGYSHKKGFFD